MVTSFFSISLFGIILTSSRSTYASVVDPRTDSETFQVNFDPPFVTKLIEGSDVNVRFNISGNFTVDHCIQVSSKDNRFLHIIGQQRIKIPHKCDQSDCDVTSHGEFNFTVKGLELSRACVHMSLYPCDHDTTLSPGGYFTEVGSVLTSCYEVAIWRQRSLSVFLYLLFTAILLFMITFGFGCQIEVDILLQVGKKPFPPLIGFICQFGILPLIGFGLSKVFSLRPEFGFGLLAYSCSPGGGVSNVFASILGGDLTLSLVMTFLSTILSLGTMPLWMFLLGRFFIDQSRVVIPYMEIVKSLALLAVPCLLGFAFNRLFPKFNDLIRKITKWLSILFIFYQLIVCGIVNAYMFKVVARLPVLAVAVVLLPIVGFIAGYIISWVCRLGHQRALTIALETGIQNVAVPVIMLMYAFPQPDGDLGAVVPLAAAYFTVPPLQIIYLLVVAYKKFYRSERWAVPTTVNGDGDDATMKVDYT